MRAVKTITLDTSAPNMPEKCPAVGCIGHIDRQVKVKNTQKAEITYKFRVHFLTMTDLLSHAGESVGRKVQSYIRNPKKTAFPQNRVVDINSDVEFAKTEADLMAEIGSMSQEELRAELEKHEKMMSLFQKFMGADVSS